MKSKMVDGEQVCSIEPHKNVPIIRVILMLLNATTHFGRIVAIVEAVEPVLLD
jgi:hypothetical protein